MILFPNAKINLGLRIVGRRPDGYHNLESIMVPVGWCDILEMVPNEGKDLRFHLLDSSLPGCSDNDNLVVKALRALEAYMDSPLPGLDIYLRKVIPFGAGLGGGSSDAAFAIRGANELFGLGLGKSEMACVAAKVGADCPFFIYNRPMYARGIGEILEGIDIPALEGLSVLIAKPASENVSTKDAYAGVSPKPVEGHPLTDIVKYPAAHWPLFDNLRNDFEDSVFPLRPEIARVKKRMHDAGAVYTSMSGSGASVYGLFDNAKMAEKAAETFVDCETFCGRLTQDVL